MGEIILGGTFMTGIYTQNNKQINVFAVRAGKVYFHRLPSWKLANEPMTLEDLQQWTKRI